MLKIKLDGLNEFSKSFDKLKKNIERELNKACNQSTELIRQTANRTITPMDTGALINTSYSINITVPNGVGAECIYGDPQAPYALYVETIDSYAHGSEFNMKYADKIARGIEHPRRPQESAHFLSITASEQESKVYTILENAVKKAKI